MVFVDFNSCFTDPKQFIRLIILMTCVCVTVYELEICIQKLIHPPVTTLNMVKLNDTMKYPAITICRKPAYKTQLFLKYGMRRRTELSNKGAFSQFKFDVYSLDEFMEETTYHLNETLQFFGYNSIVGSKSLNISSNLYLQLGKCHTFSTSNVSSDFSMEGGMIFYLGNSLMKNLKNVSKQMLRTQDFSAGFNIFLHDSSEFITDQSEQMETYSQYIFIELGEAVYLNLEVKEFHMVDHSDQPCVSTRNYSQSRCLEECMHDKLMKKYLCSLPWMKGNLIFPSCNDSEIIDDMNNVLNSKRKAFSEDCDCPKPCHLHLYLPKILQRNPSKTSPSFSLLYLGYTSNIVTIVEQVVSYDWSAFIGDLGGSLGLFLGLSVIGLIEVIEMFLGLIFRKRRQKKREEERVASLRDLRVVGRLLEYILLYKQNRQNGEVVLKSCESQKF